MRKLFLALILITITLCLFVGCSSNGAEEASSPTAEQKQPVEDGDLSVVSMELRSGYTLYGAETSYGYYESDLWDPDEFENPDDYQKYRISNIMFTDYGTAKKTYLCSVPACTHNSESCTSYMEHSGFLTMFTLGDQQQIYLLSKSGYNYSDNPAINPDSLYIMNKDGTNRRLLYDLPMNEVFAESPVIADNNNIYAVVSIVTEATEEPTKELRKINATTGEAETLFELSPWQWLHSAYQDMIVFVEFPPLDDISAEEHEKIDTYRQNEIEDGGTIGYTTLGYSLSTGETTTLHEWTTSESFLKDRYQFAATDSVEGSFTLISIDLSTGERKEYPNLVGSEKAFNLINNYVDGYITYYFMSYEPLDQPITDENGKILHDSSETLVSYYLNLETGENKKIDLPYSTSYSVENTKIYAQTDDEFLVISGQHQSEPITRYGNDGVPYEVTLPVIERALISKQDYFNSVANFRYIENLF